MNTLKQEEVYLANCETYLDALENLPSFMEEVYKDKRVHSGSTISPRGNWRRKSHSIQR